MEVSDFKELSSGELVRNLSGQWTFMPRPLPPALHWTLPLVQSLGEAERALGRLVGIGQSLRDPSRLLVRSFLRREAEFSSRIEGTHATFADIVIFEQTQSAERRAPDVREVANNLAALEVGLESVAQRGRPISLALIREMHAVLMRGVRGGDKFPGQFRTIQAHIGASNRIEEARFVPPPPHLVLPAMEALERYIQSPGDLPTLVRTAMIHYQFEAIHPFADGNGRIGRVLILLQLAAEGVLPEPLLNPSAFLESHRREYYDLLLAVSQHGAWDAWVRFFLRGIAAEADEAVQRIDRLQKLHAKYYQRFQRARSSALVLKLIDRLFITPAISLQSTAEFLGVTATSAQRIIDKLKAIGVLREITGQQRNRLYMARQIIAAVQGKKQPTNTAK